MLRKQDVKLQKQKTEGLNVSKQLTAKQFESERQEWRAARLTEQLDNIEVTLADKDAQLIKAQQVVMSSKQQTEILRSQFEAIKSLRTQRKTDG